MPQHTTPQPQMQVPQQSPQGQETEQQLVAFLQEMEQKIEVLSQRVDSLEKAPKSAPLQGTIPQGNQKLMNGILTQVRNTRLMQMLQGDNASNSPPK